MKVRSLTPDEAGRALTAFMVEGDVSLQQQLKNGLPHAYVVDGQRVMLKWRLYDEGLTPVRVDDNRRFVLKHGQKLEAVIIATYNGELTIVVNVLAS